MHGQAATVQDQAATLQEQGREIHDLRMALDLAKIHDMENEGTPGGKPLCAPAAKKQRGTLWRSTEEEEEAQLRELDERYARPPSNGPSKPSGHYQDARMQYGPNTSPVQYQSPGFARCNRVDGPNTGQYTAPPYSTNDRHPVMHCQEERSPVIDPPLSKPQIGDVRQETYTLPPPPQRQLALSPVPSEQPIPCLPTPRNTSMNTTYRGGHRFRPKFNLREFGLDERYTIDEFISVMDDYVKSCDQTPESEVVSMVRSYLKGVAATIVIAARVSTWQEIRGVLLEHYRPEGEDRTHMAKLMSMRRLKGESPLALSVRIRTSTNIAHPESTQKQQNMQMIQTFLLAMDDNQLKTLVLASNERSFRGVVELASRLAEDDNKPSDLLSKKPAVLHFGTSRANDELEEATVARISKIFLNTMDNNTEKGGIMKERGRSKERRPEEKKRYTKESSNGRRDTSRTSGERRARSFQRNDEKYRQQQGTPKRDSSYHGQRGAGSQREGRRDGSYQTRRRDGSYTGQRDRDDGKRQSYPPSITSTNRPRSTSRNQPRNCYKCQAYGHFIVNCPSERSYKKDGTIDYDRENFEKERAAKSDPNGPRTS